MIYLIIIIYELNEQNDFNNKKLLLKFLVKTFREKSNIELTKIFVIEISNLLRRIKNAYKHDDILQNIIQIKISRQKKFPFKIIKNNIKFELRNCKIQKNLLYVNNRFYILNNSKLYTKIIRNIHDPPSKKYANKLFIYNRFFHHYY